MNIFVLDQQPQKAAEYHCDKHVVKMILETAQLLSTTARFYGIDYGYKLTHKNHPCSVWLREGVENIKWAQDLGLSLCDEYKKRYNKSHKSSDVITNFPLLEIKNFIPDLFTKFKLAMPDQYRTDDAVESYRQYYIHEKKDIAKWKNSQIPYWWKNET